MAAAPAVSGLHSWRGQARRRSRDSRGRASHGTAHRSWQGAWRLRVEIWGSLEHLRKLPKWNPQTQVLLGDLGRPGTPSHPPPPFWASGFVRVSPACSMHCLLSQAPPLWARVLHFPFPQLLFLCLPWHRGREEGLWEPRGAQLRCLLKPGDTDSAVDGPQLDRSGEQHGGRGTGAGLRSHPQRGEDREME